MSIIDSVFGFFVEEAQEHLGTLEEGLLQLEKNPELLGDLIEPLFRAAHTLKGSANLVNVTNVGMIAHRLEDLLESIRDGKSQLSKNRVDGMLFALDQMRELIHIRKSGETAPDGLVDNALAGMAVADSEEEPAQSLDLDNQSPEDDSSKATSYVGAERREPSRRGEEAGVVRVSMDKIESLMGLVGEFTVTKNHLLDRLPVLDRMKGEIDFSGKRLLKEVTGFSELHDYTLPAQKNNNDENAFDELEFDRYDELNLFSRKLREITNDIEVALKEVTGFFKVFSQDIYSLDRMTEELKEQISAVRTVPAGQLFQRFNRPIRDMAQDLGKPVELCISGGETAIDRVVYDGLYDPLLHIVRNAFAHGIETREQRLSAGKQEQASIWLNAVRRGNTVEITVEDDGRGIDLERVHSRAVEKGFITDQDQLSEDDLIQMIFRPGFSTTEQVDSESGRGVGMNVVMDRLAHLNGTIDIWTEAGKGARFKLRLPLSLVIVNVIQFTCCGQKLVIPSALVDEIIDLEYEANKAESSDKLTGIEQANLGQMLKLSVAPQDHAFGIVTQSEGMPIMLLVDRVLGQEDTVIKPFGSFLADLQYFSGTSLAGDGTMRLVINPARMKHWQAGAVQPHPVAAPGKSSVSKVLVVDDSLSVRKYANMILEANGFSVITANNGQDALEKLVEENVFSIITDLEMPIMHGYDLLRELSKKSLQNIPVAVLTSRAGNQHRKEAFSLGATDYLVKPFDEDALLKVVKKHRQQTL